MECYDEKFEMIIKKQTLDGFRKDPSTILPYMPDFGFDPREVGLLKTVISDDGRRFMDAISCSDGSAYGIVSEIANYCCVSKEALASLVHGIRTALNGLNTEMVDDDSFEKFRRSTSGIFLYSSDMKKLLKVKGPSDPDHETINRWGVIDWCDFPENVSIPGFVTEIKENAFSECKCLWEVRIPESVTKIGKSAFWGRTSARFVVDPRNKSYSSRDEALLDKEGRTLIVGYALVRNGICSIPDSVTEIREGAFWGCSSLQEVHISDSVTEIGERAFWGCSSLREIRIPDSVTGIGEGAFWGCTSARFIVDPKNELYSSRDEALFDKEGRTLIVGYPLVRNGVCSIIDSVTVIGRSAFSDCDSFQDIRMPNSLTEIGEGAFRGCSSLKEIRIPDSVTEIGESAFSGCRSLREVRIPESVTQIGKLAFSWCKSLREVRIPDSVTRIGEGAFWGCSSLIEIRIPESVTKIGKSAFDGCSSVIFIVDPNNEFYSSRDGLLFDKSGRLILIKEDVFW